MAKWEDVAALGAKLDGVAESTWYGTPALKFRGKGFCRLKDDETLVARVVDLEDKDALIAGDPSVFFTTPHYDGYAYVLVSLPKVSARVLAEVVHDAWRTVGGG